MEQRCVIKHRYEVVHDGKRISIFDRAAEAEAGELSPLHVISAAVASAKDACLVALKWLHDEGHLSQMEFYHAADEIHLNYRKPQ